MGISIYIGEAYLTHEEYDTSLYARVVRTEHHAAPMDCPDVSGKSNGRHLSHSRMSDFADKTGTKKLFYDEDHGLIEPHPGCRKITIEHLEVIQEALNKWKLAHPDAVQGGNFSEDEVLERLIWFDFWMRWALINCSVPAIENY